MGFGDFINSVGDGIESGLDSVASAAGSVVDSGAHLVGDGLNAVGLHSAAHAVDSFGDDVADSLGAQVGESQLGESDDPKDLVHGDAKAITDSVGHLRKFAAAFEETGQGLVRLDSDHWHGQAADAFRTKFEPHPRQWLTAGDACRSAADALDQYAQTVSWAQDQAQQAIDTYKAAKQASQQARDDYNRQVDWYNQEAKAWSDYAASGRDPGAPPPTQPGPFQDPGQDGLKQAREMLRAARQQRDSTAESARTAVDAVTATAPAEPSFLSRMGSDAGDAFQGAMVGQLHLAGGVVKGAADIVKFGRGLDPMDPYNLSHPATYLDHVSSTAAGLLHAGNHPTELLSAVVGSGWGSDPFEAGGKLITNIAFGAATGGGGEAAAVAERAGLGIAEDAGENAARNAAKDAAENAARRDASAAARDAAENPSKEARTPDEVKGCGDPVDVATGQMFLRQTDLTLPGSLPLLFERSHTSAYRSGRWMGPTWACTADERLTIDAEGVLLLRADGGMLVYPHPVPGVPTMPVAGSSRWPLALDAEGRYTITDPLAGLTRTYIPEPEDPTAALLTEIRDRSQRWIAFDYDEIGAPVSIRHHGGYHVNINVDDSRIAALHLTGAGPDGSDAEIIRFGYTNGHLTHVYNSSDVPQCFEYDSLGRMTAWVDRNNSRYEYVYDRLDRCTDQGGTEGHLRYRYEYAEPDPVTGHRTTHVTNSLGHTTTYLVDVDSQIVAETDALGATFRHAYDSYGHLLSMTNPLGATLAFEYDDSGNLVTATRPDGGQSLARYNDLGLPELQVDPDGSTWRQTYDAVGNRTSLTDPTGATSRFAHDPSGHLAGVTDALGSTTVVRCNVAGLVVETIDALGGGTVYRRDGFGRPVAVTDALGGTTRYTWSVEGLLTSRTTPDGAIERWTYDGEGNVLTHTDQVGGVTRMEYTHFDLLTARTGPDGARYAFTHDTELRLVQVANPQGQSWSYSHDPAGRLIRETDFNGRTIGYTHDTAGRVTARTNGLGEQVSYSYDLLGNLTAKDAAGQATSFTYDRMGRLTSAVATGVRLSRTYDPCGRLTAETVNGRTISSGYDALGRRLYRRTASGAETEWAYDVAGNLASVTMSGNTLDFVRDAVGRETARRLTPDLALTSAWDSVHRLTARTLASSANPRLYQRNYTYRADGNLVALTDMHDGTRRFDLDTAGRVTAVQAADWTERYAYDTLGNLTDAAWPEHHHGDALGSRTYQGTLIRTAGRVRYDHDAQGRITTRTDTTLSGRTQTWRYTWDAEDRLTAITTPDGTSWRYTYDPFGRRIGKRRLAEDDTTVVEWTDFTWDGTTLAEQTAHGPTLPGPYTLTWDHDGLHPIGQTEQITNQDEIDRRFFAIITDLVGTPTHLISTDGSTAWQSRTTLWGATTYPRSSTTYTPLRFPGQYYDPETRLHYNLHRYYDPTTARYLSTDPLGLEPAPNPHCYVRNPHTWSDPLGLVPCPETGLEDGARKAIEKFHNLMKDPIGEVNSEPFHNHYSAARREAAGEVIARKENGTPFSHISDLQQARDGLINVKKSLDREGLRYDELTPRGQEILDRYQGRVGYELRRLNKFLDGIGYGKTPPYHSWPAGS